MTELEQFKAAWKFDGQRAEQTRANYERVLFRIWKRYFYPNKKLGGYPISSNLDGESHATVTRVLDKAVEAGLLLIIMNYSHGCHTRIYDKNKALFKQVFGEKFKAWQNASNGETNKKIDKPKLSADEKVNKIDIETLADLDEKTALKAKPKKINDLNYDIYKLYELKKTMLPHYFDLMKRLNAAARDDGLKFTNFLNFDDEGLPTGRPRCEFCATLNDKKSMKKLICAKAGKII
jgi:hypothetical protein